MSDFMLSAISQVRLMPSPSHPLRTEDRPPEKPPCTTSSPGHLRHLRSFGVLERARRAESDLTCMLSCKQQGASTVSTTPDRVDGQGGAGDSDVQARDSAGCDTRSMKDQEASEAERT